MRTQPVAFKRNLEGESPMDEYKKNDLVTLTIEDIGSEGEGIGKADGFPFFVKDAVPGDTLTARVLKSKKTYAYARTEKVITPSPFRVEPPCAFHRQCGGCQLQAIRYEKQLEFKQRKITQNLVRIGGFSPEFVQERMEEIIGMDTPLHYRNKAQYPVGTDRNGNLITGFYAGRTHDIIANTNCLLGPPENQQILEEILAFMRENGISAYDERTGEGLVRHILIRKGFTSGEIMVCLVINYRAKDHRTENCREKVCKAEGCRTEDYRAEDHRAADLRAETYGTGIGRNPLKKASINKGGSFFPGQEDLIKRLSKIPGMASISVNINAERTNVILGREVCTLWGQPAVSDVIHVRDMRREGFPLTGDALTFKISPLSFYQVNPVQTEKLYSLALEYAGLTGKETVWDLYCGIGTISLFLARRAKQVYGVEIIPQAIEDARENARRNNIANAEFFVGKAEEVLPEFYARNKNFSSDVHAGGAQGRNMQREAFPDNEEFLRPDVIVVDPPRKGCDAACLSIMLKMQPERIVYVSCDSATLARDLKILCEGGYEIRKIRGVDQFGMTVHVETVCLLSKLNVKQHIEVELTMDEMDLTAAEKKASYEEIKEYVLEKFGMKVSHLYIAQVKRKCGIIERKNYNKPKSEDSRQPKCPPEKEAAIRAALEHFKMI